MDNVEIPSSLDPTEEIVDLGGNGTVAAADEDYYYDYDPVESFDVFDWQELGPSVAIYSGHLPKYH